MKNWWMTTSNLVLAGLVLATVLSFVQGHVWWVDLTAHFRWQYILLGLVLLGPCFANRRQLLAVTVVIIANLVGVSQSGFAMSETDGETVAPRQTLSATFLNMNVNNQRYSDIVSFIVGTGADVAVLSEVPDSWQKTLAPLLNVYPYYQHVTEPEIVGEEPHTILMLSRYRLTNPRSAASGAHNHAYFLSADINLPTGVRTVVGIHLPKPLWPGEADVQEKAVNDVIRRIKGNQKTAVVVGDFNMTPFARRYQKLLAESGLRQSNQNFFPSWPSLLVPAGIPIDHVLTGPDAEIIEMSVGPDVGSDHRPVIARISLK
jgi:endonuclease/exonuclease/phosphatase (EEP) superfamily protein YafD